ncbi:MAG: virulence RhuM family protein [Bryobacterales bacterium]|nr:virulence RhuM family protein [Bryobacterales bacterium]
MGLTTWKNAPEGRMTRADVSVAKNYLGEDEIKSPERIVSMYLDYAENQATRRIAMRMQDWVGKLDAFLQFNEYEILRDAGRVTHEVAKRLAETEYEKYRHAEDHAYVSDFENAVKQIASPEKPPPPAEGSSRARKKTRKAGE